MLSSELLEDRAGWREAVNGPQTHAESSDQPVPVRPRRSSHSPGHGHAQLSHSSFSQHLFLGFALDSQPGAVPKPLLWP